MKPEDMKVIAIVGPTASGKTAFAIQMAKFMDGAIISGDSMQVYKGMDIATAKVTKKEARGIPHFMIDIKNPGDSITVAEYQEMGRKKIEEIKADLYQPIICGGTGLYIDSLLYDYDFNEVEERQLDIRNRLEEEAREKGCSYMWNKLKEVDEKSSEKIHENDIKRVIRALEYFEVNEKPISENTKARELYTPIVPTVVYGISLPREQLYERIDKRVDKMMETGLLEEAKKIYDLKLPENSQCLGAIGYKELFSYFENRLTLNEAIDLIKQNSRHYAKRQLTWFRRNPNIIWLDGNRSEDLGYVLEACDRAYEDSDNDFGLGRY